MCLPEDPDSNKLVVRQTSFRFVISRYQSAEHSTFECRPPDDEAEQWGLDRPEANRSWPAPELCALLKEGYVYVFRNTQAPHRSVEPKIVAVFRVQNYRYTPLRFTQEEIFYDDATGPDLPYAAVKHYGLRSLGGPRAPLSIVDSPIKISHTRIFGEGGLRENPAERGILFSLGAERWRSLDAKGEPPTAEERNEMLRVEDDAPPKPYERPRPWADVNVAWKRQRRHSMVDGKVVVELFSIDPFAEARRRNANYCNAFRRLFEFRHDPRRNKIIAVAGIIEGILELTAEREDYVDMDQLTRWQQEDHDKIEALHKEVEHAASLLVDWLRQPLWREWHLDHAHSEDDEIQERGLRAYAEGIAELMASATGQEYLKSEYARSRGYLQRAIGIGDVQDRTLIEAACEYPEIRRFSLLSLHIIREFAIVISQKREDIVFATHVSARKAAAATKKVGTASALANAGTINTPSSRGLRANHHGLTKLSEWLKRKSGLSLQEWERMARDNARKQTGGVASADAATAQGIRKALSSPAPSAGELARRAGVISGASEEATTRASKIAQGRSPVLNGMVFILDLVNIFVLAQEEQLPFDAKWSELNRDETLFVALDSTGTVLDLGASSLELLSSFRRQLGISRQTATILSTRAGLLAVLAGAIDVIKGAKKGGEEYKKGNIRGAVSWYAVCAGGFSMGTGSVIMLAASTVTVLSGGLLVIGALALFGGYLAVKRTEMDAVEQWISGSYFGRGQRQYASLDEELQAYSSLLIKVEVELKAFDSKASSITIKPRFLAEDMEITIQGVLTLGSEFPANETPRNCVETQHPTRILKPRNLKHIERGHYAPFVVTYEARYEVQEIRGEVRVRSSKDPNLKVEVPFHFRRTT